MNMVYCRACAHQIDDEAAFCQKCGASQNLSLTPQVASIPSYHSLFFTQFFPLSDFFFSSKGRISRVGFIVSVVVFLLAAGLVGAISGAIGEASHSIGTSILFSIVCLPFLVYSLVVAVVKRFHDMGMSGIYFFYCLIPFLGIVPFLALIFCGSDKDNDYGPNLLNAHSFGDVKSKNEQSIPNSLFLNTSTPDVINESTQNSKSVYSDSQQQATNQAIHTSPSQPNWGDDTNPLTDHQDQGKNWILIFSVTFVAVLFCGGMLWMKFSNSKIQSSEQIYPEQTISSDSQRVSITSPTEAPTSIIDTSNAVENTNTAVQDLTQTFIEFENQCDGKGLESFENALLTYNGKISPNNSKLQSLRTHIKEPYAQFIGVPISVDGELDNHGVFAPNGEEGDAWTNFIFPTKNSFYHGIPLELVILSRPNKDSNSGFDYFNESLVFDMPLDEVMRSFKKQNLNFMSFINQGFIPLPDRQASIFLAMGNSTGKSVLTCSRNRK